MNSLTISASPHIAKPNNSTRRIMLDVLLALMPVTVAAVVYFGYHVVINAVVCMAGCFGAELLYDLIATKKWSREGVRASSVWDCSCLVSGLLLALNLPSKIKLPAWDWNFYVKNAAHEIDNIAFSFDTVILCLFASIFIMMIVKKLFGGIGKNFVNPAAMGRIFLFAIAPLAAVQTIGLVANATTGATWLTGSKKTSAANLLFNMFIGNKGSAAVGETCIIAIIIGYLYLSIRKVIDFRLPLIVVGSAAVFALLFDGLINMHLSGTRLVNNMLAHVCSGGLIFGAVFMVTDYATSPNTFWGQVIYCIGVSLVTMLIRVFADYPEGMSFAIVIMNITVPLIDRFVVPRPFGYYKEKKVRIKAADGSRVPSEPKAGGAA